MNKLRFLPLAIALASTNTLAVGQGEFVYNGFGTVGMTRIGGEDDYDYGIQGQTNDNWRGDQLSNVFVQGQYGITDILSLTAQFGTRAEQDSWEAKLGNLYLAWQVDDNLTVRGGRLATPAYMLSETLYVGFAHPWLRLPDEVYSLVQITHHQGLDVLYNQSTPLGALSFQVSGGSAINDDIYALDDIHGIDYRNVFATNIKLSTDQFGTFSIGYGEGDVSVTFSDTVNIGGNPVPLQFLSLNKEKGKFSTIGHQYDNGVWLTSAEAVSLIFENDGQHETTAFYAMGGRRFGDWLPHVTYAQRDQPNGRQVSMTYGLNYSLAPTVTLKGELKRVDTSQGDTALSTGAFQPSAQQAVNDLFSGRTGGLDGDIVSLGVDFIF